jgi:predicted NUDIX family phosphoesterase
MERLERIRPHEREVIEDFLRIDDWQRRISAVFVMTASPADAMSREKGLLPVEGTKGSIMNKEVLEQMLKTTHATIERMKREFRIFEIDTSSGQSRDLKRTAEIVADMALSVIEEHLREDILSIQQEIAIRTFGGEKYLFADGAAELIKQFDRDGTYSPREEIESDRTQIQALPVVVIRNKNGDVLLLRRRERSKRNPLNEKVVIWAGGHVRKEDQRNGDSILQCALREVQEELRLSLDPHELKLRGAVYSQLSEGTSKHVAIVYEWRAEADDVAVVLSTAEFFERRGTSLSGSFVPLAELAHDVDTGKISEEWSVNIVRELLIKDEDTR